MIGGNGKKAQIEVDLLVAYLVRWIATKLDLTLVVSHQSAAFLLAKIDLKEVLERP